MNTAQPFGTWNSPISPKMVTTTGVRLGDVAHAQGAAFWTEARPADDGRVVVVKSIDGQPPVDLFRAPFNARTRVHEYGGGSWWVDAHYLYFVHWVDQRLYRVVHSSGAGQQQPEPITPEPSEPQSLRYADGCVSTDGAAIICVQERHGVAPTSTPTNAKEPKESQENPALQVQNELVIIDCSAEVLRNKIPVRVVASGADFYSTPRFSPCGQHLSWIQWSHPQMPWDGAELMLADVQDDWSLANTRVVAGDINTSVMGALWTADGQLVYASDESAWWNLYRYTLASKNYEQLTKFTDREVGSPAWVFGTQRFVELRDQQTHLGFAMVVTHQASDQLMVLTPHGDVTAVETTYSAISSIAGDGLGGVVLNAQPCNLGASISLVDCKLNELNKPVVELKSADALGINQAWISAPEAISFASNNRQAHAFFYSPAGHNVGGEPGELPPLIVMGHGGPTSHATAGLKLSIQYWTSRGIAVVDVNYGGSSGFGRDYRRLLNSQWGVVDVQDCVAATEYLAASGRVDGSRMVIRGGSAGGLTVLRALQTSDRFAGGTSLYGVTDLEMLAGDTHKFESRYLDGLLGGPYPEHKATYVERSPIHHAQELSCPILVLQGDEDKVVPPNQSAAIVDAAAKKGLPHAYVLFAGEQHGFRQTKNIIRALQIELWFYGCVLSFVPSNNIKAPTEAVGLE